MIEKQNGAFINKMIFEKKCAQNVQRRVPVSPVIYQVLLEEISKTKDIHFFATKCHENN